MFSLSHSKVFYSKVEPYEIRNISSNVSGLVSYIDENMLGKRLTKKAYLRIDSEIDSLELLYVKDKIGYLRNIIKSNQNILKNLEISLEKTRKNYKTIESLKTKSILEKDREFQNLISSENQYLNTKKELQNLKIQMSDLKLKKARLIRNIDDKSLTAKNFVLYSILVQPGNVVGIGAPLAQIADVSKAKLTIYLDDEDLLNPKNKVIYIDGVKTTYKISRVLNISDTKNISKYMAQIIIDSPKVFSKVVKIELKDG